MPHRNIEIKNKFHTLLLGESQGEGPSVVGLYN
jgi:hypothetical protein